MISAGDIVLFRFPSTDLESGKLRPALLLKKIPNEYGDWLVCMVSTQLHQRIENLEFIVEDSDEDFGETGLKKSSLIRTSRLAVVDESMFEGKLGTLSDRKHKDILLSLANWLSEF